MTKREPARAGERPPAEHTEQQAMEHSPGHRASRDNPPPEETTATVDLAIAADRPGADPCDVACDAMPGLVLGDLSDNDKAWVVDHTRSCTYCANMLGGYRQLDRALDRLSDDLEGLVPPAPRLPAGRRASFGAVDSPIGTLMIAVSEQGVCEIAFGERETEEQFLSNLRSRGFRPVSDPDAIQTISTQLAQYFRGERNQFEVPFDVSGVSPFTKAVLEATAEVPFGSLTSYRGIARRIDRPKATRAVGNALGRNPIPVLIPCHRIVRSDSSLGGYTGGLAIKKRLLALEGIMLPTG